jgi:prepilin-type N-terminal cleavage/methylation domain-containing protein
MKTMKKDRGFTIVELLIVIVVIGILAAITIVAYNGVQNRARTSAAESAANTVVKKAEAYNADEGSYPDASTDLTGAADSETYALSGITFSGSDLAAAPSDPNTVDFSVCPTTGTQTGVEIGYWNFTTGARATKTAGSGC